MKKYKPYLTRVDLVKNQVERERIQEQEAAKKRKQRIQEQNRQRHLRYQEQLRSELAARYFHGVVSAGGESFSNTKSMNFDGIDDIVDVGTIKPTGAMTISYWFKGKSTTGNSTGFGCQGPGGQRGYQLGVNDGTAFFFQIAVASSTVKSLSHTLTFDHTQWYHFAGVFKPSTHMKMYIDGQLVATTTSGVPAVQYTGNSITTKIGSRGDGGTFGRFIGNMDEVAIWDTDLEDGDIENIYNNSVPADLSTYSPLSWWRFEGTGATATDSGTGGNDGTINGATRDTDVPS